MRTAIIFALIPLALILGGCASSTYKTEYECKADDGISPCLTTQDVDHLQPVPKSVKQKGSAVLKDDAEPYNIPTPTYTPGRIPDQQARMWFAPVEDTQNDLWFDQQYIWFVKKGRWAGAGIKNERG
ncbi:TraV family lipoprotein [Aeromonas caviae]|uniref:TraV family lipoprotein n=1 Tax=Aeromonas caviae TaxID=648 RepID=UPI001CC6082C|nr:TraV family lipoprotein [Aeromonas caviae]GJB43567.1 hypothetical protein KAM369_40420 [Aeromonas caviae]GJB66024.1 hypothetical protein KAM375_40780 [Aeromonas caviae]